MAHYALINKENIVVEVISGIDENVIQIDTDGTEVGGSTEAWERFYQSLPHYEGLTCKRTSYNTSCNEHNNGGTPFRGNFASVGYKYDQEFDVFIAPQPYLSWKLDYTTYSWKPPVAKPDGLANGIENFTWKWSESNKEWIKVTIPTE